jgi:putative FmdB family regulatory protein
MGDAAMPLYEYACATCGEGFTLLQSVHARPEETTCPACGGGDVARRMSSFAPSVPSGGGGEMPPGPCGMGGGGCGGGACGL